jgi:hypothetical protein
MREGRKATKWGEMVGLLPGNEISFELRGAGF